MKKTVLTLLLPICIAANAFAQELTTEYFTRCNEFLQFLKDAHHLSRACYLWSTNAKDKAPIFTSPRDLKEDNPWECYQSNCFSGGRFVADTIRLSQADMNYMTTNMTAQRSTEWKTRLQASTGLMADEPWITETTDDYDAMTAPLFFQNATVCIVYFLYESPGSFANGYRVYKKDKDGWAFVTQKYGGIACGGTHSTRR